MVQLFLCQEFGPQATPTNISAGRQCGAALIPSHVWILFVQHLFTLLAMQQFGPFDFHTGECYLLAAHPRVSGLLLTVWGNQSQGFHELQSFPTSMLLRHPKHG